MPLVLQVPECLLNPSMKRRHPIHTNGGSRSMTSCSTSSVLPTTTSETSATTVATEQDASAKKIQKLMPLPPIGENTAAKNDASDSESEEETRVINDIDYEALEDIWLKAGEIEAKDMTYNEKKRKRTKDCGLCRGCKLSEDCGDCKNCQENRTGTRCLVRRCKRKKRRAKDEEWSVKQESDESSTDDEWNRDSGASPERKKNNTVSPRKRKTPIKLSENNTNQVKNEHKLSFTTLNDWNKDPDKSDEDDLEPPPATVSTNKKPVMEYLGRNLSSGTHMSSSTPAVPLPLGDKAGFASAFLSFLSPGAPPPPSPSAAPRAPSQTPAPAPSRPVINNPMIRVDYGKPSEDLNSKASLTNTTENPKTNLTGNTTGNNSASATHKFNSSSQDSAHSTLSDDVEVLAEKSVGERCLDLLFSYGVTTTHISQLQRGDKAVEKLINKAAQCRQLQSQMSPLHKQSLQQSNKNQVHRASALAILNLLSPPLLLDLEHSLKTLTDWSGELRQVGIRWELAVRPPPGQGPRKCFIIEKKQLRELELDTVNNKCFYSSR